MLDVLVSHVWKGYGLPECDFGKIGSKVKVKVILLLFCFGCCVSIERKFQKAYVSLFFKQGASNSTLWNKYGDQGNDWQRAVVEIPTSPTRHKIILEFTQGISYHGDIAIDDIIVLHGPCKK